jgi:hypothetical protein
MDKTYGDKLCIRCGQEGHVSASCTNWPITAQESLQKTVDPRQRRRDSEQQKNKPITPAGAYTNYKPVEGRPGFYTDPFGNLMYNPKL